MLVRLREKYKHVPLSIACLSGPVVGALAVDSSAVSLETSLNLQNRVDIKKIMVEMPDHKTLFYVNDRPLPCVLESDCNLNDNWLTADDYYPLYFSIYQALIAPHERVRMLEIGVRTGYQGVVFARACQYKNKAFFLGLDPNLYVSEGLSLAGKSLSRMREIYPNFDYALQEGYSWERNVQRSLSCSGPFDIIHIDGDHSLQGKLTDLELARQLLANDGVVLVDDFDHHPIIRDAIKKVIALGWFKEYLYVKTMRGLAILQ